MSLVTISSANLPDDPTSQSSSYIQNNYKEGIIIRPGDTVALVSLSINKQNTYVVDTGVNDTFMFRIGAREEGYEQHKATLEAGEYDGYELANVLQSALNSATWVGVLAQYTLTSSPVMGGFSVSYVEGLGALSAPRFSIFHTQQGVVVTSMPVTNPAPILTEIPNSNKPATELTSILNPNSTTINGIIGTNDMDDKEVYASPLVGDRGIFGNGGYTELRVYPVKGMNPDRATFVGVAPTDTITKTNTDSGFAEPGVFQNYNGAGAWDWVFTLATGGVEYWRIIDGSETNGGGHGIGNGSFGVGSVETDIGSHPGSWDIGIFYFNELLGRFQSGNRTTLTPEFTYVTDYLDPAGGLITNPMDYIVGFPTSKIGYCREQLWGAPANLGDAGQNGKLTVDDDGADLWITLHNDPDHDTNPAGFTISVTQLITEPAPNKFPDAGWRTAKTLVDEVSPLQFHTLPVIPGQVNPPINFTNYSFTEGSWISLYLKIDYLNSVFVRIGHGPPNNEYVTILKTGIEAVTNFQSTIRESFFPLRPCMTSGSGAWYRPSQSIMWTLPDKSIYYNPIWNPGNILAVSPVTDPYYARNGTFSIDPQPQQTTPLTPVPLQQMYKFGKIIPADLIPSGTLPVLDALPNGYVDVLTGLANYYFYGADAPPTAIAPIIGINTPFFNIGDPSVSVELMDFNISGYNGLTGDTGKQIAFIPKEQLETGENSGILHYYSRFPIDIALNVPYERTFYSLTAMLRTSDGKLAVGLLNPTEMTLLIKEGDESKQVRVMTKAMEAMRALQSDIQTNDISRIGNNNPLL